VSFIDLTSDDKFTPLWTAYLWCQPPSFLSSLCLFFPILHFHPVDFHISSWPMYFSLSR